MITTQYISTCKNHGTPPASTIVMQHFTVVIDASNATSTVVLPMSFTLTVIVLKLVMHHWSVMHHRGLNDNLFTSNIYYM